LEELLAGFDVKFVEIKLSAIIIIASVVISVTKGELSTHTEKKSLRKKLSQTQIELYDFILSQSGMMMRSFRYLLLLLLSTSIQSRKKNRRNFLFREITSSITAQQQVSLPALFLCLQFAWQT